MAVSDAARTVLRDPLTHFLIGGALIFAFFAWRGEEADPASRTISVDRQVQAQIALDFERTLQRAPTDAELDALIARWVREEVLYREALRLGFDAGDPVVRRRLAKKMDFLAASSAQAAEPTGAELERWYRANGARYAEDTRLSFDQVFHAERPPADARPSALGDWRTLGDPSSLPESLDSRDMAQVAAMFGRDFAKRIAGLEPGSGWTGPLASGVGWHFVRLRKVEPGKIPALSQVRGRAVEDWRQDTAQAREEAAYRVLRDAYRVRVER